LTRIILSESAFVGYLLKKQVGWSKACNEGLPEKKKTYDDKRKVVAATP